MKSLAVRERLYAAQAEKVERGNQLQARELVPAADVAAYWVDITTQIRSRLLAIPARVAARHPGHPEIVTTLEREIHAALNALADSEL